jgi:hypothetical protein
MPTIKEQLSATVGVIDSLLLSVKKSDEEPAKMAASEVVTSIAAELAGDVSDERKKYLQGILEALAKSNFESTSFVSIKVVNDSDQIKPETVNAFTVQSIIAAVKTGDTHWAANLRQAAFSSSQKAEIIKHFLMNREDIAKGQFSDKLDQVKSMFGLSDEELRDDCDVRWKVSDLLYQLTQAAKLERMVEGGKGTGTVEAEKSAAPKGEPETKPKVAEVWPIDMAKAEFDPKAGGYKEEELFWGKDSQTSRR